MTEPTDAGPSLADQLFRLIRSFGYTTHGQTAEIVDAIVAKWGTPPAVAGDMPAWQQGFLTTMNQDPYPALGGWFVQFWEGDDVAARVYGNDAETLRRRCAAITTPQPSQAQAVAVPLTDEQIVGVMHSIPINAAPSHHIAFARAIEQAHNLAVKLKIRIGFIPSAYADTPAGLRFFGAHDGDDQFSRTRLAIVRAAAAIGLAMP